jgi:hypothetical protein
LYRNAVYVALEVSQDIRDCNRDIGRASKEVHGAPVREEATVQNGIGVVDGKCWIKVDIACGSGESDYPKFVPLGETE